MTWRHAAACQSKCTGRRSVGFRPSAPSASRTTSLINRENYSLYQPMLPEVISGSMGFTDVVSRIRQLSPRTELITREVENIDLKNKLVTVSPGFRPR